MKGQKRGTQVRLKFYVGRTLAVDHTWNLNKSFIDDVTHDAESMIEEAIETNVPGVHQKEEEGLVQ